MRSKLVTLLVGAAVTIFAVLGYLSWKAKYGKGKIVTAVAVTDAIVIHQRAGGQEIRGPFAQDRLIAIDGRTGIEYARTTALRGELVGARNDKAAYSTAGRFVFYDARTLESSPAPEGETFSPLTTYGAMTDLGNATLLLDAEAASGRARASRLTKEARIQEWTTDLPWTGHDTKLVARLGAKIVIVDADAVAAVDEEDGSLSWVR